MNKRLTKLKSLIDNGSAPTILEVRTNSREYSYEDVIAGLGQKIKDKKTLVAKNKLEKKQNRVIDSMKTVISSGDRAAAKIYGNKDRGGKGLDTTNQGNWDERNAMDTRAKAHKKGV